MRKKMKNKISKRSFLKKMTLTIGLLVSQQSFAIHILENMQDEEPNKFQKDLVKNPKKQILIAEIAECVGYAPVPDPLKMKCLSTT